MSRLQADTVRHAFRREGAPPPRVLVVGDLMLDRYLWGEVERISPEAPVPVVHVTRQTERLGGTANVAANLAGLGVEVTVAGHIGRDAEGGRLEEMLELAGIRPVLVRSASRITTTKTRVIGGHQQMLRLDQEEPGPYASDLSRALAQGVLQVLEDWRPGVVILSDYAKGTLDEHVCRTVIEAGRARGIPVLVDPKGRDYGKYRGATALTPNQKEAADACGVPARDVEAVLQAAEALRRRLGLEFMPVTRGEHGIALLSAAGIAHLPATAKQVYDVSGAGDTVIATLATGLLAGLEVEECCRLANLAAGIVVGKVGTIPVSREELLHEIEWLDSSAQGDKICTVADLRVRLAVWRGKGERIVFTNGCFDLLHAGHVTYLETARALGDRLIVGLNTDRSVRALKGPSRPVIHEEDRARVMAALESVDAVVLFDEETPIELIRAVRPDVLVKGDDYTEEQVVGGAEVKSWGGRVALIPVMPGRSTSGIIARLNR
jgi:D-beta-D-heptose 7-phosphate kinase/D-beta-D-heptose 1-phosphate adenosyltransferase